MVDDNGDGSYGVSFTPEVKGAYQVSTTLHGENIKGSPFELRVHCVSAEKSTLKAPVETNQYGFFFERRSFVVAAIDQDETPLTQGGDQFTVTLKVNDQIQVS